MSLPEVLPTSHKRIGFSHLACRYLRLLLLGNQQRRLLHEWNYQPEIVRNKFTDLARKISVNDFGCSSAGVPLVVGSDYRNQTIFNEYVAVEHCSDVL
jgi:hypothetical protein